MTIGYYVKLNRVKTEDVQSSVSNDGLMDSAWPMFCHDVRHTGRSPYGKDGDYYLEKWRLFIGDCLKSSPAIDENGTIYLGSGDWEFFAVYSNGTEKWRFKAGGAFQSSPAIAEDGTIYVGSDDGHLYAFYPFRPLHRVVSFSTILGSRPVSALVVPVPSSLNPTSRFQDAGIGIVGQCFPSG